MDKKQAWLQLVREKSEHYLNLHDGGFDEKMQARLVDCDYEAQTVTYAFPTQTWQINEKGGIHGGAIAGMFDTAFGVVANFTAGDNEATTTDMTVSFLRGVDFGVHRQGRAQPHPPAGGADRRRHRQAAGHCRRQLDAFMRTVLKQSKNIGETTWISI